MFDNIHVQIIQLMSNTKIDDLFNEQRYYQHKKILHRLQIFTFLTWTSIMKTNIHRKWSVYNI